MFSEDLPNFKVTAGKLAFMELPEIFVAENFSLKEVIIRPSIDLLSNDIYFDSLANEIVYDPQSNNVSELEGYEGASSIEVTLVDSEGFEYKYEMNLTLKLPLRFG